MNENPAKPKVGFGQRAHRAAKKLGITLLSTVACLLILEIVFRIAGFRPLHDTYSKPELFWRYDALLGWSHEPNASGVYVGPRPFPIEFQGKVHLNSMGLRGPEIAPLPAGGLRVLFLGDSVVAGFEVDDDKTFVSLLEPRLATDVGAPVQTINAGVRGYGTDQAYLLYRERLRALRPDVVVFQASNNDLEDNTTLHRARRPFGKAAFSMKPDGSLELVSTPVPEYAFCAAVRLDAEFKPVRLDTRKSRTACWAQTNLADHSALFTFATMRIQQNPKLVSKLFGLGTPAEQATDMQTHGASTPETPASRLTTALIRELARTVRADGARFVLAIRRQDLRIVDRAALDGDGIEHFDLSTVDDVGPRVEPDLSYDISMHFLRDSHFTEKGHTRLAELMTPFLAERLRTIAAERKSAAAAPNATQEP